jgi:hypothetical protein
MNLKQKILTCLALTLFIVSVLFAPWEIILRSEGHIEGAFTLYSPVFHPPWISSINAEAVLGWQSLLCTWFALGVAYSAGFALLN